MLVLVIFKCGDTVATQTIDSCQISYSTPLTARLFCPFQHIISREVYLCGPALVNRKKFKNHLKCMQHFTIIFCRLGRGPFFSPKRRRRRACSVYGHSLRQSASNLFFSTLIAFFSCDLIFHSLQNKYFKYYSM